MTLHEKKLQEQNYFLKLISKKLIEDYYKDHSYIELREYICNQFNCKKAILDYLLKFYDIHKNKEDATKLRLQTNMNKYGAQGKRKTPVIDKDILIELYVIEHLPIQDIIIRLDNKYSESMIRRNLHDYSITRSKKDNPRYKHSPEQKAKREATNVERYGCKNPMQNDQIKQKSIDKKVEIYGENWGKIISEKSIETYKERTGLDNPFQDVANIQAGMLKKYGVTNTNYVPEIKAQMNETWQKHYGQNPEAFAELVNRREATKELKYGDPHYNNMEKNRKTCLENNGVECIFLKDNLKYNLKKKYSGPNQLFYNILLNYFDKDLVDSGREFTLSMKQFDFKIDKYLIEINPWITHNSNFTPYENKKGIDKYYHQNKTKLALENGYTCIHIWDWTDRQLIIDQLLQNNLPSIIGFEEPRKFIFNVKENKLVDEESEDTVIIWDDGAVYEN